MSTQTAYLECKYGKIFDLDVHGLFKEEAKAEIIHCLDSLDIFYKAVLITHGYHNGHVLKDYVRNKLRHVRIKSKVNIDASRTLLILQE